MSSFDGTGALEARLEAARQMQAGQKQKAAAKKAAAEAAYEAGVAARADESAALVAEFIERANRLRIRPKFVLPGIVEQTLAPGYKGQLTVKSERRLDSTRTGCWHLGKDLRKEKSLAYPAGMSFNYFLSERGLNIACRVQSTPYKTWFVGEDRIKRLVSWVPRTPDVQDVVYRHFGDDYTETRDITLVDAMVTFFQKHETAG